MRFFIAVTSSFLPTNVLALMSLLVLVSLLTAASLIFRLGLTYQNLSHL